MSVRRRKKEIVGGRTVHDRRVAVSVPVTGVTNPRLAKSSFRRKS